MAELDLLLEAERRGILPPDRQELLDESRRRGLLSEEQPKAQETAAPVEKSFFSRLTDEAANMATFGLADYAGAAGRAIAQDKPYFQALDEIKEERGRFQQEHPASATAAQVAGGLAFTPTVMKGAVDVARAALPNAPKVVSTALGLAGGGAIEGGIYGGLESRPGQNIEGATAGAVTGAVVAPAVAGSVHLLGGLLTLTGNAGIRVLNHLASRGPTTVEERKLLERITADGMTPRMVIARLRKLGGDATIADAGGENVRGLAEALANEPGYSRNTATRVLMGRQRGQSARLARAAQDALGAEGDFYGRQDILMRQRSADASPLYDQAFAMQPLRREGLTRFVDDPIIKRGINRGLEIQRLEALADNVPFNPKDYAVTGFDEAGNAILGDVPNIRLMDAAKRGLDAIIQDERNAITGRLTERGRAVNNVRRALLAELDDITGGEAGPYAQARAMWAGPSQALDAMNLGRRFMRGDHEITARTVNRMSPADREFFREGVFQEIQHRLGSASETRDQTLKFLHTPNVREALRAVFPSERAYREFIAQALKESRFTQTKNTVIAGSPTGRREAERDMLGIDVAPVVDVVQGSPVRAGAKIVMNTLKKITSMSQSQKDNLGRMLFSQDPAVQQRALLALQDRYHRGQIRRTAYERIMNIVAGESAMLGAEASLPNQ